MASTVASKTKKKKNNNSVLDIKAEVVASIVAAQNDREHTHKVKSRHSTCREWPVPWLRKQRK